MSQLQVSRVRSVREFEALTERNARAAGHGTLRYRIARSGDAMARDISTMGNATVGTGEFAYVVDHVGKETTFLEPHAISVCISSVLQGRIEVRPYGDRQPRSAQAGGVLLFQGEPGLCIETSNDSARQNLWLNGNRLQAVLEAKLDRELTGPLIFDAAQTWPAGTEQALQRAVAYAAAELADPLSFFSQGTGTSHFEEMIIHSLLDGVPHNYSAFLATGRRPVSAACAEASGSFHAGPFA